MEDPNVAEEKVEAIVGTIVWVRRRNGSWWPGRIISEEELLTANLLSPRSGTPVKLLGREDGSVDWYNIQKSKRVKAFRCGDFEECIERAKALAGHSAKRREKYARREDAILDALELEKQQLGSSLRLDEPSEIRGSSETSSASYGVSGAETLSRTQCVPCYESGHVDQQLVCHVPEVAKSYGFSAEGVSRAFFESDQLNQELATDCKRFGSTPRMRGLEDFGLKSANDGMATHWKRKRSVGGLKDFSSKRRDSKEILMQVLENSAKLSVTAESISDLLDFSVGDETCGDGNQSSFASPRRDTHELPVKNCFESSSASSVGLHHSGCKMTQTRSMLIGSLDQGESLSTIQISTCPSIKGSKCSMNGTYHGKPCFLSKLSINNYPSNAEHHCNNLEGAFSGCMGEKGLGSVEVSDQMGSTVRPHTGQMSLRSQKAVLYPLRPSQRIDYLNNSDHKSCQNSENGSPKISDEANELYPKALLGNMLANKAGEHEAESLGVCSRLRDFVNDFVSGSQFDKVVITKDSKELMNVEFLSNEEEGKYSYPPFNCCGKNDINNNCRNQILSDHYAFKSSKEADENLHVSTLAKKSTPKLHFAIKDLFSQDQKHFHRSERRMLSSKNEADICKYSSTASFSHPDAIWCNVQVDQQAKGQKESVPMVLLASRLNRKPIIGYPVVVVVAEPNKFDTFFQSEDTTNIACLDAIQPVWQTGRRSARHRGHCLSSAVVDIEQRKHHKFNPLSLIHQADMFVASENCSKSIDRRSKTPFPAPHNAAIVAKKSMFDRKRLESLYKAALSKRVLKRVCLSARKIHCPSLSARKKRTRTLSSIAQEPCHRLEKHVQFENAKSWAWIQRRRVNGVGNSSDPQRAKFKSCHENCMAVIQHSKTQGQSQELPFPTPSEPAAACIPVRVALARLKAVVYDDQEM